ncbi:MAG: primosomal protein N' [Sporolactobacillus sp.]
MIAEVYVDIPATAIDRAFDYRIPEKWQGIVHQGMRVTVPFGATRRLGFVTRLKEQSDLDELKALDGLIDPQPVLTKELLELGRWLSETTLCPTIAAYQAMLPAVMKAAYRKRLIAQDKEALAAEFAQLTPFFANQKTPDWEDLVKKAPEFLKQIQKAMSAGVIRSYQQINNQATLKKVPAYRAAIAQPQLIQAREALDSRAGRQKDVLDFFAAQEDARFISVSELTKDHQLSRAAILRLCEKGWLVAGQVEQRRDPYAGKVMQRSQKLPLTEEQQAALTPIKAAIIDQRDEVFLCRGVTGSGKTELYLQAIDHVLTLGRQAIVLVPEISLTPQMAERFKRRFGDAVAVLHSGLSKGEKYDEWRKIRDEQVSVVVGARSAVFAPFQRLGLIVIDEEHEGSYKQEDQPRYHARDVAIHRAGEQHCPVVLGSATPSLESFARAQKKVYTLLTLNERFNHHPLPPVAIIDMREEMRAGNHTVFSRLLLEKLKQRLDRKQQTVLFLNRRGYSTFVMCRSCGDVLKCPHCDISLTYHRQGNQLKCHYCGFQQQLPEQCPVCGSDALRYFGAGTQKVEAELTRLLPEARVIRMDVDTTRQKGGHERLLRAFGRQEADILLGTQMIAKGLDFPNVTLVGVLSADSTLHLPDFRASEKTFQLLTQVSGRAGRHELPGEVIIQSYTPEHYAVVDASTHDYLRFYTEEMQLRHSHGYPPFYYLVLINLTHPEAAKAAEAAERIAAVLRRHLSREALIYGPVVPSIARIKDRYRYQCMVKYKRESALLPLLRKINSHFHETGKNGLHLSVDLNPVVLM